MEKIGVGAKRRLNRRWRNRAPSTSALLSPMKRHLDWLIRFAQLTAQRAYTLQWLALPLKIALLHGESGPPCNIWLIWPTRVQNPNGMYLYRSVQPFLHGSRS